MALNFSVLDGYLRTSRVAVGMLVRVYMAVGSGSDGYARASSHGWHVLEAKYH